MRPPCSRPLLDNCHFVVRDPNYGIGIVEPYDKMYRVSQGPLTRCVAPLVAAGTRVDERSLWGVVVDDDGKAVPETVIKCRTVVVPGGTRLNVFFEGSHLLDKCVKVLTDSEGIAYEVAGYEDQAKQFILPLSERMTQLLRGPAQWR